jgi:hypothetical protein
MIHHSRMVYAMSAPLDYSVLLVDHPRSLMLLTVTIEISIYNSQVLFQI